MPKGSHARKEQREAVMDTLAQQPLEPSKDQGRASTLEASNPRVIRLPQ